jgi:transcription antitermination protein NusB
MSARRKGRELALQVLYQLEMSGEGSEQALRSFAESFEHSPPARAFGEDLVRGVLGQREQIDGCIATASEHWRMERLSRVDANIIRIAVYEMTRSPALPIEIAINEAIEVARKFGTAESAAFVNGLLDQVAKSLGLARQQKAASPVDD